jgi:hypothetical protein
MKSEPVNNPRNFENPIISGYVVLKALIKLKCRMYPIMAEITTKASKNTVYLA